LHRRAAKHLGADAITEPGGRPCALDLEGSIDLVCVLLRTNLTQDQAACLFGVSQATASRRWDVLRDTIADALDHLVPAVREVVGHRGSVLVSRGPCRGRNGAAHGSGRDGANHRDRPTPTV
jgi:hypothetical protein